MDKRSRSTRATVARLVRNARIEVFPTPSAADQVARLPGARTVTITASPSHGLEPTVVMAERMALEGRAVVPHLAARMIGGRSHLAEIVERLAGAGVTQIFVPAGDAEPVGDYRDALSLLRDLATLDHPFTHIGIPGYPESHPLISDDLTVQSMWDKRHHASHIVSNLTFSATTVNTWVKRLRERGVTQPVLLGIPGPVQPAKLLAVATKIGVGDSTRFLRKNTRLLGRLVAPGGFTGERFLLQCASDLGPEAGVDGLHVYSFNQIAESEAWLHALGRRFADGNRRTPR